ncbi:aminoglycoside 6-adenylyltransferase [Vibrio harveyi]|uniref:aminoglycoside 6-adenylyltransferase n=1 Tax=Vibrio harveyi TaxID=669 RepID=UPI000B2257CF|nr:nucleotidyltransferase domain-containing protein [Vibrio harveyi]ELI0633615.1 aminoglycoside 6-adenylyltransferase [Vibrio harveyi]MCR9772372.1 nucleotidyltransferase domain-containing protein [Vibrio harveyi]MDF6013425.1 aminoglycoside 6-adenylyltransferase [Vibrio harveyi]WHP65784.1 aminoglycoside 6-adenylyltransferase [Vibrio harveyi]HDM8056826.1 aminoglycoside 6-adenylyltransferase [Vibrio harveyi]
MKFSSTLPQAHEQLLKKILAVFTADQRILGIGASGSYASDSMDKYSDLDLVIAINPDDVESVMTERFALIDKVEGQVAAFTGEHVGEPRLVIAIYAPDAIHVDFKFVALQDAAARVDHTKVLWERDGQLSQVFTTSQPHYPQPDPQWIEDRFWIWVHYGATKIARGEYFEAAEFLSFLRSVAISPLALQQQGLTPSGVRKIESRLPEFSEQLKQTVAMPERDALIPAFQKIIELYLALRENEQVSIKPQAQQLCMDYFTQELMGK